MARESEDVTQRLDDEHYPAYSMGRAAEMIGATPGFLRSLDEAKLLEPQRSGGGHRRYSRHELRLAARVRELLDDGTALDAACRIVLLENQLDEARRTIADQRDPGRPDGAQVDPASPGSQTDRAPGSRSR
jgi:DNA-binding transcriptional MerR regulator